jgi:diaminohydroxyphosphoribosylaminopyrimidine deaminase/5-amino-6-(5-phosphoribosylamino)uracil reductase
VLWKDGQVVGEGWHRLAGEGHAEVLALQAAAEKAHGATAYVTLEPCAHHGRTGPCTDALIKARVARVVIAMPDPFATVAGQGSAALQAAGIEVDSGLLESGARALNEGFLSRVERGRPFVRLKLAASIDGATAMQSGESQWITGEASRRDVQRLRASSAAIMTGIGTVLADDPALTVRDIELPRAAPLRVIVDSNLRTPPGAQVLSADAATLLCCTNDSARAKVARAGVEVLQLGAERGGVSLAAVLAALAQRDVNELLVEAGPRLAGALMDQGLVDELVIYQAPHIMGSETRRLLTTPGWQTLQARMPLRVTDRRQLGADLRITARPVRRAD